MGGYIHRMESRGIFGILRLRLRFLFLWKVWELCGFFAFYFLLSVVSLLVNIPIISELKARWTGVIICRYFGFFV